MHFRKTMLVAIAAAGVAIAGCDNTAQGLKEDAKENEAKAREEAREAEPEARDAGEAVREAGRDVVDAAEKAGDALAGAVKDVTPAADAAKQTLDVKAALMADSAIDSSKIDVDTDATTRTVTLKGTVPTAAQKASAERIARSKASGYTVKNMLVVARS